MLLSLSSLIQAVRRPVAVVDAEVVGELKSDILLLRTAVADNRDDHSPRDILSSAYLVLRTLCKLNA